MDAQQREYLLGLLFIGIVVVMWVGSAAFTKQLLDEQMGLPVNDQVGAFFVTYLTNSLFLLYLPICALTRAWRCSGSLIPSDQTDTDIHGYPLRDACTNVCVCTDEHRLASGSLHVQHPAAKGGDSEAEEEIQELLTRELDNAKSEWDAESTGELVAPSNWKRSAEKGDAKDAVDDVDRVRIRQYMTSDCRYALNNRQRGRLPRYLHAEPCRIHPHARHRHHDHSPNTEGAEPAVYHDHHTAAIWTQQQTQLQLHSQSLLPRMNAKVESAGRQIQTHTQTHTQTQVTGNTRKGFASDSSHSNLPSPLSSLSPSSLPSSLLSSSSPSPSPASSSPHVCMVNQTQYTPVPSFQYAVQRALLPSLLLSPLFFLMNYLYNLSLQHTSLSSSSILSSTSGLWLLLLARVFFRQPISTAGLVGSLCILIGAVAISSRDYAETHQYRPHRGTGTAHHILNHGHANGNNNVDIDFTTPEADGLLGDVCVTLSEICYAGYTLVLHRLIPNELHPSAIDIQVLLGLMGTWTLLLVWPGLFLLHWTGIEPWTSPPSASLMCALVISGVLGAVVPDYLWQRSVVMTSPLVSTLGLTLTIPLSVALDAITQPSPTVPSPPPTLAVRGGEGRWYSVGATLMMVGFLVTNYEHTKTTEQEASASDTPVKDGERFEGRREHNRQLTRVRWSGGSAVATSKRSV